MHMFDNQEFLHAFMSFLELNSLKDFQIDQVVCRY